MCASLQNAWKVNGGIVYNMQGPCRWDIFFLSPLLGIAHEARHAAAVPSLQPLAQGIHCSSDISTILGHQLGPLSLRSTPVQSQL